MERKILLQGYIGHGNFGDDLLFYIAIKNLSGLDNAEFYVLDTQQNNIEYLRLYLPHLNIIKSPKRTSLLFFKKFDKVYYIGGGVFFDYSENLSFRRFIKKYISNTVRFTIPRILGTQFAGIGIGIGPYFNKRPKRLHSVILKNFKLLGVRDTVSFNLAQSMGVAEGKLFLTNDLSLILASEFEKINIPEKNEFILCPRLYHHKPDYEKHIERLIELADSLENEKDIRTHWIFLQNEKVELIKKLENYNFKITVWNPDVMSIESFVALFKQAKGVFSSRMHSLFIAGMVGTPFVAIELHQKLRYASELFYSNPIILHPLDETESYIDAYGQMKTLEFRKEKLAIEVNQLLSIKEKLLNWLGK